MWAGWCNFVTCSLLRDTLDSVGHTWIVRDGRILNRHSGFINDGNNSSNAAGQSDSDDMIKVVPPLSLSLGVLYWPGRTSGLCLWT